MSITDTEAVSGQGRPKINRAVKKRLIDEAGGKCANPGCSNLLVEIHHIVEWHVCLTHDPEHMIALCPACHDAVNRGDLRVTNEIAYEWKRIRRRVPASTGHLYVEPGPEPGVLAGQMVFRGSHPETALLHLSAKHRLSFRIIDGDILLLNMHLAGHQGDQLIKIIDGHIKVQSESVELKTRAGMVEVPGAFDSSHVPDWARKIMESHPSIDENRLPLLKLEVVDRALVQVEGCWIQGSRGVVITEHAIHAIRADGKNLSLTGGGRSTIVNYRGPMNMAIFSVFRQNRIS